MCLMAEDVQFKPLSINFLQLFLLIPIMAGYCTEHQRSFGFKSNGECYTLHSLPFDHHPQHK